MSQHNSSFFNLDAEFPDIILIVVIYTLRIKIALKTKRKIYFERINRLHKMK
jgi:hypothetical protein